MPRMTQQDWDPYKHDMEILYVRQRETLQEVMKTMEDKWGLVASKRQYVYILEQWGFCKNKTEKTEKAALSKAIAAQEVPAQIDSSGDVEAVASLGHEMPCPTAGEIDHENESWNEIQSQQLDLMLAFPHKNTMLEYMGRRSRMSKASQATSLGQTILFGCVMLNDGCLTNVLRQALEEHQPHHSDYTNCLRYNLMYHALGLGLPNATDDMMPEDISRYLGQAKSPSLDLFPLLARFALIHDAQHEESVYGVAMFPIAMTSIRDSYVFRLSQDKEATALLREGVQWCRDFLQAHPIQPSDLPAGNGSVEHARQQAIAEACCAIARHLPCEPRESLPRWAQESRHRLGISRITCAVLVIRTASNFYLAGSGNQFAMLDFPHQFSEGASALLLSTDEVLLEKLLDTMVETDSRSLSFIHTLATATSSTLYDQYSSPPVVADDSVFFDNLGLYVQGFVLEHLAPEMYETDSDELSACSELDVFTTSGSHRGSHSPMTPFQNQQNSQSFAQDFDMDGSNDPLLFPQAYPDVPSIGSGTGAPDFCNMDLDLHPDLLHPDLHLLRSPSFPS